MSIRKMTWSVLLAKWTAWARASVALPETGEGGLMRASVADVIALQAVWMALDDLKELDREEALLGLDRARWLVTKHAGAIESRYADAEMPGLMRELIDDARTRLEACAQKTRV